LATCHVFPATVGAIPRKAVLGGVRYNLGGSEVGQVVPAATPGGSPAARERQVNVPLTRNHDLPYGFLAPADSVTDPVGRVRRVACPAQHVLSVQKSHATAPLVTKEWLREVEDSSSTPPESPLRKGGR